MSTDNEPSEAAKAIWLVYSNEHKAWWRPNSSGYTVHLEAAGRYTKAAADYICRDAARGPKRFDEDPPYEVAVLAPEALDAHGAALQKERDALQSRLEAVEKDRDEAKTRAQMWHDRRKAAEIERDYALSQLAQARAALVTFRDCVLNQRHQLEAPCLNGDQTNAVLALFDDCFSNDPAPVPAPITKAEPQGAPTCAFNCNNRATWKAQAPGKQRVFICDEHIARARHHGNRECVFEQLVNVQPIPTPAEHIEELMKTGAARPE